MIAGSNGLSNKSIQKTSSVLTGASSHCRKSMVWREPGPQTLESERENYPQGYAPQTAQQSQAHSWTTWAAKYSAGRCQKKNKCWSHSTGNLGFPLNHTSQGSPWKWAPVTHLWPALPTGHLSNTQLNSERFNFAFILPLLFRSQDVYLLMV